MTIYSRPEHEAAEKARSDKARVALADLDAEAEAYRSLIDELPIAEHYRAVGYAKIEEVKRAPRRPEKEAAIASLKFWVKARRSMADGARRRKRWEEFGLSTRAEFERDDARFMAGLPTVERLAAERPDSKHAREDARLDELERAQQLPRPAEAEAPRATAGPVASMVEAAAGRDPMPAAARELIERELLAAGLPVDEATVRELWEAQR